MWARLSIRLKILILFLVIALLPLIAINLIWLRSSQDQLESAADERQSLLLTNSARLVNQSLTDKIRSITAQSQLQEVVSLNTTEAKLSLLQYSLRDSDIKRIILSDTAGNALLDIEDNGIKHRLGSIDQSEAFQAVKKVNNETYVGPVTYVGGNPRITVAVPVLAINRAENQNLTTAQALARRFGADINGILLVDISLQNIWRPILSSKLGTNGYAYIVDNKGRLLAHPDEDFRRDTSDVSLVGEVANAMLTLQDPAVMQGFTEYQPAPTTTASERGISVLSSHYPITATGWSVIGEEPISSVYSSVQRVSKIATMIFALSIPLSLALILLATRSIISPLRGLRAGAEQIGSGDFAYRLPIKSRDELGMLAETFNKMAGNLAAIMQKYRAESDKMSIILNNVGEGIIAVDASGNILMANMAASVLVGDMPKDIIGKPLSYFHWTYSGKPLAPTYTEVRIYKDVTLMSRNKREHFIDVLINPITDDPGGISTIVTIIDKTSERELENMKVDFVSMAAHELRTPMTAIRGYLELILKDPSLVLPQQVQSYLGHIKASSTQLVGLINNLLNVSRIERNSLTLKFDKINWANIVQSSVADQQFTAKTKSITLRYEGPEEPVPILGDEIAITEIINNLIGNALHYTSVDGHVTVCLQKTDTKIITTVEDDGIGIPVNALDKLFTKFYRVRGGLSSGSGGTGLGLYISKSIAEMHGGTIKVESMEGEGSKFIVILPVFDSNKYDEIIKARPSVFNTNHGWITKNSTRRG